MTWAAVWDALRVIGPWVLGGGGGLVMWYLRDRRKDRAAAAITEQTVPAEVALKDTAADDARLLHLARTWETERAGLLRAIADRDSVIEWQRIELERRDGQLLHQSTVISELRTQLDEVEAQVAYVTRQLAAARHRIDELEQPVDRRS